MVYLALMLMLEHQHSIRPEPFSENAIKNIIEFLIAELLRLSYKQTMKEYEEPAKVSAVQGMYG